MKPAVNPIKSAPASPAKVAKKKAPKAVAAAAPKTPSRKQSKPAKAFAEVGQQPRPAVHTVYGVPELDGDDKGKEELTTGDRTSAEGLQLDSLHSLLDELVEAPVTLSTEQPASMVMKVPGTRPLAAQMPDYSDALDNELLRVMNTVADERTREELDGLRRVMLQQVDSAMRALMAQLQHRFASEATLASLNAEALQLDGALEAEREKNRTLAAAIDESKKQVEQRKRALSQEGRRADALKQTPPSSEALGEKRQELMGGIRALEEERDMLKLQVDNLRKQARNSIRYTAAASLDSSASSLTAASVAAGALADDRDRERDTLIAKLRAELQDAKSMSAAQTELAGKLTRATKDLTASHKHISAELESLRRENERLERQAMNAAQTVHEAASARNSAVVLKARLAEAEERRRRDVAQLLQQNQTLQHLLEDERHKSVSGETMQVMLDDVLMQLESERAEIRLRLAHTPQLNASI